MIKLLIVEPNPDVSELLAAYFINYDVTIVFSAESALEIMEKKGSLFDLVITTNYLSGMKGVKLVSIIKKTFSNIPIILISGLPIETLPKGLDAFYQKPFDIEELGCAVKRLTTKETPLVV